MEDQLKSSMVQWQRDEQQKRDQQQATIEKDMQDRQKRLEDAIRQQELTHLAKIAEEKRVQHQIEQEALIQKNLAIKL